MLTHEQAESADHGKSRTIVAEAQGNRFTGLITRVVHDTVMAQVEIQAGPHRFVSLLSREAADELNHIGGIVYRSQGGTGFTAWLVSCGRGPAGRW
jgi:molybdopterin-binding protein